MNFSPHCICKMMLSIFYINVLKLKMHIFPWRFDGCGDIPDTETLTVVLSKNNKKLLLSKFHLKNHKSNVKISTIYNQLEYTVSNQGI